MTTEKKNILHHKFTISHREKGVFRNLPSETSVIMAPVNVAKHFQYLVVGGGSGGIASARRAAEFGVSVGLIEKQALGGTCVSVPYVMIP